MEWTKINLKNNNFFLKFQIFDICFKELKIFKMKKKNPKERCLQTKLHLSLPNDICKQQWIFLGHLLLVMKKDKKTN